MGIFNDHNIPSLVEVAATVHRYFPNFLKIGIFPPLPSILVATTGCLTLSGPIRTNLNSHTTIFMWYRCNFIAIMTFSLVLHYLSQGEGV